MKDDNHKGSIKKTLILDRLEAIGKSVKATGDGRALIALGSVGKEIQRLDQYSDLDFFVIAKDGMKERFLDNLDWLTNISEPGFYFLNTKDGYKFLYKDGVFCEFAIFEEAELSKIPFSEGRFVWKEKDFDEQLCKPSINRSPWQPESVEWAMNEALTCIYVGLCRYARGEKLSGTRFIQNFAVDLLIASANHFEEENVDFVDAFQHERRFETRFEAFSKWLPSMIQGYDKTPESACEILAFIETHTTVNRVLKSEILKLIREIKG